MTTTLARMQMAELIYDLEARKDSKGHLQVYELPPGDGGGKYEVAGINQRYDREKCDELVALIHAGHYETAATKAQEYIAQNTDFAIRLTTIPMIEMVVRDCIFNRGLKGAVRILQRAIGVTDDGDFGPVSAAAMRRAEENPDLLLSNLRKARERYERKVVGRNEKSKFWHGLVNRWDKVTTAAHQFTTIAPPSEERVHGPDAPAKPSDLERGDRPPSPPEKSEGAERWLAISALELGVHETPGRKSTPRVMEYRKIAGCDLRGDDSEVPWCRIYVGAIMALAGLPFRKNWMARAVEHDPDFVKLSGPALGAIVSMWRGSLASGQGHTGFYRGETSTLIWIEGGNESDAVRRAFFPRHGPSMGLIGYYWPKSVPLPKIGPVRVKADGSQIASAE